MPASRRDRADRRGGVAGEDDDLDALLEQERDRLARLGPQLLGEHGEPERPQRRRAGVGIVPGTAPSLIPKRDDAAAGLLVRGGRRGELPEREELGRAEHEADAADPQAAPAAAGEERHRLVGRLRRSRAAPLRSPSASGSGPRRRRRSGRARRRAPPRSCPAPAAASTRRSEAVVSVPVLSMQIVSTEASDSIAFSCCDSAPRAGHAQRRRGIRDRDEQDQPLGDERHHPGDRGVDRIADPDVLLPEGDDQHRSRAAPSRRAARRGAGRSSARAASGGGGTRAPSPRSARRSSRRRPPRPRTTRCPRRRTSPTAPPRPPPARTAARLAGQDRLVEPEPGARRAGARRRRPGRPGASRTRSPSTTSET